MSADIQMRLLEAISPITIRDALLLISSSDDYVVVEKYKYKILR